MGFDNRPYYGGGQQQYHPGMGAGGIFGQNLTPVVKWLLILNIGIFFMQMILRGKHIYLEEWFAATNIDNSWWQLWRLITFQFLHGSLGHLFGNMISLFFFGHLIERSWGSRRFLRFYLTCGAIGGVIFLIGSTITPRMGGVLVGASGGILAIFTAGAILYPQVSVILFPIPIPIKIRFLLTFYLIWYIMNVLRGGDNAGGDLCHLGGMAMAFIWIMGRPYFDEFNRQRRQHADQHRQQYQAQMQYEVDRILAKVHDHGVHSLTKKEKQILQQATQHQRKENH